MAAAIGLAVGAAALFGVSVALGAFFAGLILADYAPEWRLQPRIHACRAGTHRLVARRLRGSRKYDHDKQDGERSQLASLPFSTAPA